MSRRTVIGALGAAVGVVAAAPGLLAPRARPWAVAPPSTVTQPPRDFGPRGAPTTYFTDPDVLTVDPVFDGLRQPNAPIQRLWTGALWAEGPAWIRSGPLPRVERHSEQPPAALARGRRPRQRVPRPVEQQQRQHVRLPGPAAVLRAPHPARRALRARRLGDHPRRPYNGKRLNSPNDVVPHPDGSYWFTDPPYGGQLYEGRRRRRAGPASKAGRLNPSLGQPPEIGDLEARAADQRLPHRHERHGDPGGQRGPGAGPERPVFSPDYKKLYVVSTGRGPGDAPRRQGRHVRVRRRVRQQARQPKLFTSFMIDGVKCGPDGVRADVDGNLWCSSNAGRNVGYSGVTVWTPRASLIGRIRLPEVCGNVCFGGPSATGCSWRPASRSTPST